MSLQQAVMRIYVKIQTNIFFESGFEFSFQVIYKLSNPAFMLVVLLAVADEDVVFVPVDKTCHVNGSLG